MAGGVQVSSASESLEFNSDVESVRGMTTGQDTTNVDAITLSLGCLDAQDMFLCLLPYY